MIDKRLLSALVGFAALSGFAPPPGEGDGFLDAAKSFHAPSERRGLSFAGTYASDDGSVRFVLERTGDGWLYVHGEDGRTTPVKEKVNYRGDRFFLAAEDGRVIVKIAAVGGVTAFTEERRFGVPVVRVGPAVPDGPTE